MTDEDRIAKLLAQVPKAADFPPQICGLSTGACQAEWEFGDHYLEMEPLGDDRWEYLICDIDGEREAETDDAGALDVVQAFLAGRRWMISALRAMSVFTDTLPVACEPAISSASFAPQPSGPGVRIQVIYTSAGRLMGRTFAVISETDVVQAAVTLKAEVLA